MQRYVSIWATLLIAVIVHVDWHFGRGHDHHLSLSLRYHWMLGLVAFFLLALFCARKWPRNAVVAALVNGILGLFIGQIVEPLLEVVLYRVPVANGFTGERWAVFGQFGAAAVVGLLSGLGIIWFNRRAHPQLGLI